MMIENATFNGLGLAKPLLRALDSKNYTHPTPIQAKAIPPLLAGKDLLGIAQTGTGKTAAFALPILHLLQKDMAPVSPRHCRALVLAPTRELVVQISDALKNYGRYLGLSHSLLVGGVGYQGQIKALSRGVDILIATPGRLLDLVRQNHLKLTSTSILVLDEADRMLDMGFIHDVRKIVSALPKQRQTLLFSATMPFDISKLAKDILHQPVRIEISPNAVTVDRIAQFLYPVAASHKRMMLTHLLTKDDTIDKAIVFTRTKHGANRVSTHLAKANIRSSAIHGNKSQGARQKALRDFRDGKVRVLVATDIAARGIDVADVSHVINFDLPVEAESYVHRIGRTGRAGAAGIAISLFDQSEKPHLRNIERLTKKPLRVIELELPPEKEESLPSASKETSPQEQDKEKVQASRRRSARERRNFGKPNRQNNRKSRFSRKNSYLKQGAGTLG